MNAKFINQIIDDLSFGVVVVDFNQRILDANRRFYEWFAPRRTRAAAAVDGACDAANDEVSRFGVDLSGRDFYQTIGAPLFLDGDYCPFHSVRTLNRSTRTIVFDARDGARYELFASPATAEDGASVCLVELKKIAKETNVEQILQTLQTAGFELTTFTDRDLVSTPEERRELLKGRVEKHMRNFLKYDVFEIRLLDEKTSELLPLLAIGMNPDAAQRELKASPDGYGITGYVANSGELYFCDDTKNDYLYIPGAIDARSSLTVPILYHDRVIGVCNVESETPSAFTKQDAAFLQLYAKDLAIAFRMLDLISSEGAQMKRYCGAKIRDELYESADLALDLSFSLLDAVRNVERKADGDSEAESDARFAGLTARLARSVLALKTKTSDLKKFFLNEQTSFAPRDGRVLGKSSDGANSTGATLFADVVSASESARKPSVAPSSSESRPAPSSRIVRNEEDAKAALRDRRVLIVERDAQVVRRVVDLLESYGCVVDCVYGTKSALQLLQTAPYDLVVSDFFPDGSIFGTPIANVRRNAFELSVVDIHRGGAKYFEPVENDPVDAEKRREIYREIYVNRRLDAFFLRQELDKLALDAAPAFALASTSDSYDPTHVRADLASLVLSRGERPLVVFSASNLSFAATTRQLAQAMLDRDAVLRKKENEQ